MTASIYPSKILKLNDSQIQLSVRDGLVVIEVNGVWFALSKNQCIYFVKALADCANGIV